MVSKDTSSMAGSGKVSGTSQPPAKACPLVIDDEGIQSDGFEAGSISSAIIQTGSELLCQYGICQPDTLPVLFEAGGNGAVNNLLFGEGGVDGCHLLSHTVRIAAWYSSSDGVPVHCSRIAAALLIIGVSTA